MKKILKQILMPLIIVKENIQAYVRFLKKYLIFRGLNDGRFEMLWKNRRPCLFDATSFTGFDRHYVYHTSWAARKLKEISPKVHFDFGSSLFFCGIGSAFVQMRFFDYRPAQLKLHGLSCEHADLNQLQFPDNSIESLSCMHVVEHIGLGRYGEQVNPAGDVQAINELKRVLAYDGNLLFVVPVGQSVLQYNAHRIYSYAQIINLFADLELVEFRLIEEFGDGGLIEKNAGDKVSREGYACGCFWFRKVRPI